MKLNSWKEIEAVTPCNIRRDLWSAYWMKDQYFHYQLRLPVRYASTPEEYKDPSNHYQLDDLLLNNRFLKLPIIAAWIQQEKFKNYDHWQCHVVTTRPLDTNWVRTVMYPECLYRINCYCKAARDPWSSVVYCTKEPTRVFGPYFYNASAETPDCSMCNDWGCLSCSSMFLNAP